jgi:hypothetical protein
MENTFVEDSEKTIFQDLCSLQEVIKMERDLRLTFQQMAEELINKDLVELVKTYFRH